MIAKRILTLMLTLCVFLFAAGCGGNAGESTPSPSDAPVQTPVPSPTPTPEPTPTPDPAAELLEDMTTEEKVGQLLIAGIEGTAAGEDAVTAIQEYQVGGVILFGRNVENAGQLAELNNELKALNAGQIPLFLCVDEEGGRVSRMPDEVTDLPAALTFGSIEDPEQRMNACFELGQVLAQACTTFGFNLDFAPVMDIWSNPENTVIGDRAFGTDAATVTGAANETALGILTGGVIPVAKHFPGHGDTAVDSHVGLPVVDKTLEELEALELQPFRQAVETTCVFGTYDGDTAIPAMMVAHILMTAIDPDRPASLSHEVVTGLLREQLGFDGVVFTDDLTMAAVSETYGMGEACVLAVEAGCDALLVCHGADNLTQARLALLEAVENGRISQQRLDESVYRILSLKLSYGLSGEQSPDPDLEALNRAIRQLLEYCG